MLHKDSYTQQGEQLALCSTQLPLAWEEHLCRVASPALQGKSQDCTVGPSVKVADAGSSLSLLEALHGWSAGRSLFPDMNRRHGLDKQPQEKKPAGCAPCCLRVQGMCFCSSAILHYTRFC